MGRDYRLFLYWHGLGRPLPLDNHQDELEMHSQTHLSPPVKLSLDFPCFSRYGLSKLYASRSCRNEKASLMVMRRSRSATDERTEGISRRIHVLAERLFNVADAIDELATALHIKLPVCLMCDCHTGHITWRAIRISAQIDGVRRPDFIPREQRLICVATALNSGHLI